MTDFTPILGLIGGGLIGLSAVLLLLFKGRIAGVSGILNGVFTKDKTEMIWRSLFLLGIVLGPLIARFFSSYLPSSINLSWGTIIVGSFLVGFGTNLGGGCTSGHGVCGMGRFSLRSIWATLIFMSIAMVVVFIVRHLVGVGG